MFNLNLRQLFRKTPFKGDVIVFAEHKAIYFAIPKVANSSFKSLAVDVLRNDIPECCYRENAKTYAFMHKPCRRQLEKQRILVKQFKGGEKNYWKFTVVRNPFDRLRSCYSQKVKMLDTHGSPLTNERFVGGVSRSFRRQFGEAFHGEMSFPEFIDVVCSIPYDKADKHFRPQADFVCDARGKLLVDHVARMENLPEEFELIRSQCGFAPEHTLSHRNQSKHGKQRIEYRDSDYDKVRNHYANDFELFGYS